MFDLSYFYFFQDTYGESGHLVALNSKRTTDWKNKQSLEERQQTVDLAKLDVRRRRCRRMQV